MDPAQKLSQVTSQLQQRGRLDARLRLLEAIDYSHSLTQATEQVGVSYKTGWNHLRDLKQRCETDIVETSSGGANGGGTALTGTGQQLLALMRIARAQDQRRHDKVPALRFSARNQMAGKVSAIEDDGVIADIEISVAPKLKLTSQITRNSIDRLGLELGGEVYAIVKASIIDLCPADEAPANSKLNCLPATIRECHSGAHGRELELAIGDMIMTAARPFILDEDRWLQVGNQVNVLFEPAEVMLATPA